MNTEAKAPNESVVELRQFLEDEFSYLPTATRKLLIDTAVGDGLGLPDINKIVRETNRNPDTLYYLTTNTITQSIHNKVYILDSILTAHFYLQRPSDIETYLHFVNVMASRMQIAQRAWMAIRTANNLWLPIIYENGPRALAYIHEIKLLLGKAGPVQEVIGVPRDAMKELQDIEAGLSDKKLRQLTVRRDKSQTTETLAAYIANLQVLWYCLSCVKEADRQLTRDLQLQTKSLLAKQVKTWLDLYLKQIRDFQREYTRKLRGTKHPRFYGMTPDDTAVAKLLRTVWQTGQSLLGAAWCYKCENGVMVKGART